MTLRHRSKRLTLSVNTLLIHAPEFNLFDTSRHHTGNLSALVVSPLSEIRPEENCRRFSCFDVVHGARGARLGHRVLLSEEAKALALALALFLPPGLRSSRTMLLVRDVAVGRKTGRRFNLGHCHIVGHANVLSAQPSLLLHSLTIILEGNNGSVDALGNTLGQSLGTLLPVEFLGLSLPDLKLCVLGRQLLKFKEGTIAIRNGLVFLFAQQVPLFMKLLDSGRHGRLDLVELLNKLFDSRLLQISRVYGRLCFLRSLDISCQHFQLSNHNLSLCVENRNRLSLLHKLLVKALEIFLGSKLPLKLRNALLRIS
ncbi:hypothetical protein HG531_006265 [Fusarium graminearum]|nr:hypothetical protein HG531_006265 [Fusarium graminearum]